MHKEPTNLDDLFERAIDRLDKLDAPVALDEEALWSRLQANLPQQPNQKFRWFRWVAASLVLLLCAWLGFTAFFTPIADKKVIPNSATSSSLPIQQTITKPSISYQKPNSSTKKIYYQQKKEISTLPQVAEKEPLNEAITQPIVPLQEPMIEQATIVSSENNAPPEESVSVETTIPQKAIPKPKLRMVHANELAQDEPIRPPEPKASKIAVGFGFDHSSPITAVEESRRFRLSLKQKPKN